MKNRADCLEGCYGKYMTEDQFKIEPQYGPSHNFLVYRNDVLVSFLKYVDCEKLSSVKINFKNKEDEHSFADLKEGSDIFDWMEEHGYSDEMYELEYRHTFFSLVADFCHYMLESFECAAKKKVAVAYALLRKPLRDNLYYIEWLAAEREDLLDKLAKGKAKDLVINKSNAKKYIEKVEKIYGIAHQDGFFNFRYDKNDRMSLEKIWNKANHVITTHYYTKSAQGELNFVVLDEERIDEFTRYYYCVVPLVMSYAVDLIVAMFERIINVNPMTNVINRVLKLARQACTADGKFFQDALNILEVDEIPFFCPHCGNEIHMNLDILFELMNNMFKCEECGFKIESSNYVFDY